MKTRLLITLLAAGTLIAAVFTGFSIPAAAQTQTVPVQTPSGEVVQVQVEVPPGGTLDDVQLPGTPVAPPATPNVPTPPATPAPKPQAPAPAPAPGSGPRAWTPQHWRWLAPGSDRQRRARPPGEGEGPQDHRRG